MKVLQRRVLPSQVAGVRADLKAMSAQLARGEKIDLGDGGAAVTALQRHLQAAGLYAGAVNGQFDELTRTALTAFQQAKGLPATGELDAASLASLKSVNLFVKDSFVQPARQGQRGSDILRAEKMLEKLGFRPGTVDGIFDASLQAAVRRYRQADAQVPDRGTGISTRFFKELSQASRRYEHTPYRRREIGHLKQHRRLDELTERMAKNGGIAAGSNRRAILNVERHLVAAGFDLGKPNATFGPRTEAAVLAFQRRSDLPETGRVDAGTWAKLRGSLFAATGATSPAIRAGEVGGTVSSIEKKLKYLGYDVGKVDGRFDGHTAHAVRAFQRRNHLKKTGAVGGATLRELNTDYTNRQIMRSLRGPYVKTAYRNGSPYRVKLYGSSKMDGELLTKKAAVAYLKMKEAARRDGISLVCVDGFRTYAEQVYLKRTRGDWAATPGYSNHQQGLAVDLNTGAFGTSTYNWLMRNGPKFGFYRTVPAEHWHFDFKG